MSRIFVVSHSGGNFPKIFLIFLGILYNRTSWGPPTHPSPGWKAPGSAGPTVDGPVTSPSPTGTCFPPRQTVAQPPSLVLGSKTAGGGVGAEFPVGFVSRWESNRGVFFFRVLMLHKLEDVDFLKLGGLVSDISPDSDT